MSGRRLVRGSRGQRKAGAHHITYELAAPDGRILRTRVWRPANGTTCGPGLWKHILDQQLQVSEAEFWACVSRGQRPDRGLGLDQTPSTALPAGLVYQLVHQAGISEAEVSHMTVTRVTELMVEFWSRPRS